MVEVKWILSLGVFARLALTCLCHSFFAVFSESSLEQGCSSSTQSKLPMTVSCLIRAHDERLN